MLFVLMFFQWFEFEAVEELGPGPLPMLTLFVPEKSTWDALGYIPFVFVVAISVTLVVAALRFLPGAELSVRADEGVAFCGIASALLILFRIVDPPSFGGGESFTFEGIEGIAQFPAFLAPATALGIALGGCLAMREEGFSLPV